MNLSRKSVEYAGILNPSSPQEIRIEILGLKNAIKQAEELISRHEQALEIAMVVGQQAPQVIQKEEEIEETPEKEPCYPPLVR